MKENLRRGMWAAAAFSGVRVITYCILENHAHFLVEVDEKAAADAGVDDSELVRRWRILHPDASGGRFGSRSAEALEQLLGSAHACPRQNQ